ncbi:putative RNA-directed DNA polymerase [Tanacetum coccineum]
MAIEKTDPKNKGVASGSNTELNLHVNDPLYLHANDTNGIPLIYFKLTSTDNYKILAVDVHLALHTKNKLGFINGKFISRPIFSKIAKSVWDEFKETYDKIDSVIYNLLYKLYSLTQYGSSLSEYYHSYNSLWRQFDSLVDLSSCNCDGATKLKEHKDLMRLMQFLMGFDDTYSVVRIQILTTEPLPDVKSAFATLSRVESHKKNLVHTSSARPSSSVFISDNRPNTWFNNRNNQNRGTGRNYNLKMNSVGSNVSNNACNSFVKTDQSAGSPSPFTPDQINRIMALISSKSDSGELQSCAAGTFGLANHVISFVTYRLGHPSDQVLSLLKDKIQIDSMFDIQPCDVCHKANDTVVGNRLGRLDHGLTEF